MSETSDPVLTRRGLADHDDDTNRLQDCIEQWGATAMEELARKRAARFRRSLIINFVTEFDKHGQQRFSGHQITIAIEAADPAIIKLMILEYRMHEYVYNVHGRLFQYMANAVRSSAHFDEDATSITQRVVCLKGRLRIDPDFMMCMSVSYRVSAMLSYVETPELIHETLEEFEESRRFLLHHTARMLNWFMHNPDVKAKRSTVLIPRQMTEGRFFELKGLQFVLVPFETPDRNLRQARHLAYDIEAGEFKEEAAVTPEA